MKHYLILLGFLSILVSPVGVRAQQLKAVQQIEGIPPRVEYRALTHDPSGNIYVATSADVFMIAAGSHRAQAMNTGDQIVDIEWSKDHGLLMLTQDGVVQFISSGKSLTLDAGGKAVCMDLTKNTIWVGSNNGVHTISIAQEKLLDHYTTANGVLKSNDITFIHTDPFGVRWVGTKAGVARIEGKRWKLYEEERMMTAITSTSEGAWMAAANMMWLVNSYNRWFPIDAWKDLVVGNVKALASDDDGMIYIASEVLIKYDPYKEKKLAMTEGNIAEQMVLLDKGPGSHMWMAGHNGMSRILEDTAAIVLPTPKADQIVAALEVKSNPVCENMATGHLAALVKGGTPPYTYAWSHHQLNSPEATQLSPGLYQVTITDKDGKSTVASGIIPASTPLRVTVQAESKASDKLATDGKAIARVTGGASPVQYLWSNGESAAQAVKLNAGTHTFRAIDANGCIATGQVTMEADKVLKTLDISTITLGQTIRVDKLYFEADSATIQPTSFAVLAEIFEFLDQHDRVIIEVGGHTNSLPEDEYCDRLSTARAKNVAEFLYEQGIPETQISYKGYGKRQPIATNATVEGRRRNQRVEIKIISL